MERNPSNPTSPNVPQQQTGSPSQTPPPQATIPTTSSLANAVINIAGIKEQARKELIDVLDSVRGKKGLVLDPKLSGPLGLIAEVSLLKEHGVEKIYLLNSPKLITECKNIVYLVRPKVTTMKMIANQIQDHRNSNKQIDYFVEFVPRRTMICEKVLEEEGVYDSITIGEYPLDLIPFDDDLLSLELDNSYKDCFLEGDRSSLYYVARSLMKLQSNFGLIPKLSAKGTCSKLVVDMLLRMRKEMGNDELTNTPEIDHLILIDRDVDMVTPMCTQLTYEGLIDETFGINNCFVDVDPEIVGATSTGTGPVKKNKVPLNSNDRLYNELRDLNFSVVGPYLNRKAKEIDEYYKERHGATTVTQIRDFMKRFASTQQEHMALKIHTGIAEYIIGVTKDPSFMKKLETEQSILAGVDVGNDYIEDCIGRREPILKILRLLCLQSVTNAGIKQKQLEYFEREIIQSYGYEYLFCLKNLEKMGLLKKQETKSMFPTLRKSLNLIVEDINENAPNDVAYVYSGYAPISIRLIQGALRGTWRNREFQELLKMLPGPVVEEHQSLDNKSKSAISASNERRDSVTLVFFVGGVTFTEIAALRWLTKQQEGQYGDIIIGTTKLINGDTLLGSFMDVLGSKKDTPVVPPNDKSNGNNNNAPNRSKR